MDPFRRLEIKIDVVREKITDPETRKRFDELVKLFYETATALVHKQLDKST